MSFCLQEALGWAQRVSTKMSKILSFCLRLLEASIGEAVSQLTSIFELGF